MSEFAVEGPDLKKMVARARKQPVSFAFNPGQNAKDHMLGMDRRKAPELVGRSVRKSGPSMKIAFGTAVVEQRVFVLTCEKALPAMAKKVKAALKANKVMLNVRILGPDGELLEEDIEDLPPEEEDEEAGVDVSQDRELDPAPAPDTADLAQRLQDARKTIGRCPAAMQETLQSQFSDVLAQIKAKDLPQALAGLARLETALAHVPDATAATTGVQSPQQTRLEQACDTVGEEIAQVANPVHRTKLGGVLDGARALARAGEAEKAVAELKRLRGALARVAEIAVPEQTAATAAKVLPIWTDAKDRTDTQLSALQTVLKGSDHPLFEAIADKGLHGITEGELSTMIRASMAFDAAVGETVAEAAGSLRDGIARMRAFLDGNRGVALLDENEMGVAVTLRQTLGAALEQIETAMARRLKAAQG